MHPVNLIALSIPINDPDRASITTTMEDGICAVTGVECSTVPRKQLFGPSFTDRSLLASPNSDRVGMDAYAALKYKWERMSSWICDGKTFSRLDRIGVRNAVLGTLPKNPWCAYATVSYKKHGSLRTVINSGNQRVWLFENRLVDCTDINKVLDWWNRLNQALRQGFGRPVLETLDCPVFLIERIGLLPWIEFEQWAVSRKNSALYEFLCYLLPSQKELQEEQSFCMQKGQKNGSKRRKNSRMEDYSEYLFT